jgi:hypothetical protein
MVQRRWEHNSPFWRIDESDLLSTRTMLCCRDGLNWTNWNYSCMVVHATCRSLQDTKGEMSVSCALRIRCTCMATSNKASTCFISQYFEMQIDVNHVHRSIILQSVYRVTHSSILLGVTTYSMFNGGPPHGTMLNFLKGWCSLNYHACTYLCT